MKKYIFLTTPISDAGGSQCYVAAKAAYLESEGWEVHVISPTPRHNKCLISSLEKYRQDSIISTAIPVFYLSKRCVTRQLNRIVKVAGGQNHDDEIIVESHEDVYAFWGELLANRLHARHYYFTMNESYRGVNKFYESKIDFFIFKFRRREILGNLDSFTRLFDGYIQINREDYVDNVIINESPIFDVLNENVNDIKRYDWNIAYLGRGNKSYVPNIIKDIGIFSSNHPDKKIQFISISNFSNHKKQLEYILKENQNLIYTDLGYLHPIPESFFSKIDIMIAGSGSARHSVEEGVLTIVADPEHKQSNGFLGYETMNSVVKDENSVVTSFCDALERGLINKAYLRMPNRFPKKTSVAESTAQNFWLFSKSDRSFEYFDSELLLDGKNNYNYILTTYIGIYCPKSVIKLLSKLKKYLLTLKQRC